MHKLIPQEIQPDGRQPFELKRTNSWDYSTFNLQGLFELASIGQHMGMDLWNYKAPQWNSKATIANSIGLLASIRFEKTAMALSADSITINQYKEFVQFVMSSNHTLSKE